MSLFSVRAGAYALAGLAASTAQALPMGSVDTWMVMGDFSARSSELAFNRAFTPRDAFGAVAGRWRSEPDAGGARREYGGLSYTRLLQRWNLPDAQANLWFVGTAGALRASDAARQRTLLAPALMADYETTRVYASLGWRRLHADTVRQTTSYARAGFSFYEVDYDEVQPWLVVEAKRQRDIVAKTATAAWLRLIHKRYFIELGADDEGRARASFMLNLW